MASTSYFLLLAQTYKIISEFADTSLAMHNSLWLHGDPPMFTHG